MKIEMERRLRLKFLACISSRPWVEGQRSSAEARSRKAEAKRPMGTVKRPTPRSLGFHIKYIIIIIM